MKLDNIAIVIAARNEGTGSTRLFQKVINEALTNTGYGTDFIESHKSNIKRTLALLHKENASIPKIVIDDGSTDDTALEVENFQKEYSNSNVTILRHDKNYGKGAALRTAYEQFGSQYEFFLTIDADLLVSNGIIDRFAQYTKTPHKGMAVSSAITAYESKHGNVGVQFSGTRLIKLSTFQECINKLGKQNVIKILNYRPYGLEAALGCLFEDDQETMKQENTMSKLPRFLPSGRAESMSKIVTDAYETQEFFTNIWREKIRAERL